ncbi:Abortive infection bacteriophage resistance protein [Draconibacterium orientale]|uniref:Abortive infection bacteriophage resistance protein n=1 Tax=Draconibacterium orientale TaxID=1168034 RepID=X5DUE8_9BACT|nr:Abi family protein [Draconibacterium orientale]AHW58780.1 DNA-binding protein [Draconibacterium orientale]SET48940.1 Abortive infection bacteriophage resistance protein [Draconibacterium orientale]
MGNIATDTATQIALLQERGMTLDLPEAKITEHLLDIGYYRLGFYWYPFQKNSDHEFVEGTKFSDVIKLYYLDTDLRILLIKYTNRIEINFRTKVIYYVSNYYKESPTWFADPAIVNKEVIDFVDRNYNQQFIKNNKPIKEHHLNHINDKYAPAWKTLEFLTFGIVFNIYRNIRNQELKEQIANEFGVVSLDKFYNLFKVIIDIRNSCAHGDVLYDYRRPRGMAVIPSIPFNNRDRSSLDSCIRVISYFLGNISKNRQLDLKNSIKQLFGDYADNPALQSIISEKINYNYEDNI